MFFTADRLLVLALAVTLLAADGLRRVVRQWNEDELDPRAYRLMVSLLVAGILMSWSGVLLVWLRDS